jgi:hypothetical protein
MPKPSLGLIILALAIGFALNSARGDDKPASSQPAKVEVVDFKKLKELLPEEAAGVKRSNHEGEKSTIGEFTVSTAIAEYTKPDADDKAPHAKIEIKDFGGNKDMVAGMAPWQTVPINIENDQGYQRTAKLKENPAFETYTKEGEARQMTVVVAGRFLVSVEAGHVSEADFKKLTEALPLDKLAELK